MVALALMVSCMPSAYTISASEAFGDGTEDIFTDGEITSEPAAEESTPDVSSADQEETEQAQQSTLTYENDSVKVTAEALEDGALPQNTALKADGVNENSSVSYDTVSQKLSAAATDKGSSLRGFFAYDVYFADGDGNRVEPNGRVRVTFEYKTPAAPELTDAASTSVTVEKLHYNSSTGDTDVNTLQANEDLKVLNVNEGKQIQTLQVETGNAAVFAVMWDSPETADVEAEAVSGNEDEVSIASEELTDGMDISDEPEQDAAETPAAENPEVTPDAEPSEAPAENPDAEPTEAPAEDPDVVEEPAEDIASPEEVPAADENGETSLIKVLGDDTNLRVSPSVEAEVLATVNAGTQLTLLDTVTAEDGATWYKVSWEGTEAYIRSDMAQVVDSSDEAEEVEDVQEEEIQPEITRYDYTSDEVNVKVTLTDPADLPDNAELSVTPVELSQEAEDQITEEAIKEKKAIEKIHSYDIKFLVDGEEVQPGATVKVSVSLNDEKKIKDADVYHVDENDNVENMDGSVAKNGDVEFETTHFSTYVIVQKGRNEVEVTIQHLNAADGKAIYSEDKRTILVGGKINDYTKAKNWDVSEVKVNGDKVNKDEKIVVAQNSTIEVYYTPKRNENFQGPTSFYDYTVKAGIDNKTGKKYSFNMLGDAAGGENGNEKITSGKMAHNYDSYQYNFTVDSGYDKDDGGNKITASVNDYNENVKRTEGLLKGVEDNGKGAVKFNYPEPGFFVDEDAIAEINGTKTYLRRVIKDYKLVFDQIGDSYKLKKVIDERGEQRAEAGHNFFPLDNVSRREDSDNNRNYFFGMRYDVTFKIGDYVGPLNYTFTGDDDLWVVLDGTKIVIDLGGIHQAATKTVNLKPYVEGEDKEKEHTLTILYMERGAYESNCQMEFTLPSARISEVTNVPTTDLVLKKVNKSQEALGGARFNLVNNSEPNESQTATSVDETGIAKFTRLRPGEYTLTEALAPNGYEASQESWIVKVTLSNDNKAVATLYKADGKTTIEKDKDSSYHIMNYTQQEIIESSMDYSKTATVNDWDKRTYDINITASSKTTSSSVVTTGGIADVVMALDVSGSMSYTQTAGETNARYVSVGQYNNIRNSLKPNKIYYYSWVNKYPMINVGNKWMYYNNSSWKEINDSDWAYIYEWPSRITALKEVVNQFIRNTATSSSESNIGLAPFNTAVKNATETLLNVDKNKDTLIKNVSRLSVIDGTSPHTALNKALELLNNAKNPKYVILFTDGEPTGPSDKWDKKYQQKAETAAKSLKDKGIKVFTVGFALSERGQKFLAGDKNDSKNYPGIASEGCAFNAANAEELAKIFETIQNTVTEPSAIQNATITDVIDPRFVILDKDGKAITADQLKDGKTVQVNDGTVYLDAKGNQCIKWEGQTIPNKKENEAGNACWSKSIKVKAKDDYIGGNNVPTNVSPDSKISTGYGDAILPQPTVNVKADLTVDNLEKVIFLGDPTPTADLPDSMLSSILQKSKNYVYNETTKELEPVRVTRDDLTCSWAKDETFGNDKLTDLESMAGDHPTEDPTRYYLKVTYNAGEPTETVDTKPGSTENTGGHIAGGKTHTVTAINSDTKNYPSKEYGVYTIHIIKGQIQITKKLEDAAKKEGTFTFNIYKGSADESNLVKTVTATVKAGNTDAKFTMGNNESEKAIVAGLARGEYIVQEVSLSGYQFLDASNDSKVTNCKSEKSKDIKDIKFTIGTDNDNKNALEAEALNVGSVDYANYAGPGCVGKVDYTNKETVANVDFVKVDAADNNITINGAMFTLYKADESWTKGDKVKAVTSENGGTFGFEKLLPGNYLLNETKAATGYSLVTEPWKIVIKNNGEVTVTKNDGKTVIVKNSDERYKIENAKVYSLPESGGPGTYGFTISGVAILATALLLFIKNKRREEEAKRS